MTVRRVSRPPTIAPERAQHSEASKFHDQIQLAKTSAPKALRPATVSTDDGGRNPGLPALYLGGNSAMRQSWSYAPVHHDVAAQVETQDRSADVDQDPYRDGWEQCILDAQQRQAEAAAAEAAEELAALEAAADAAASEAYDALIEALELQRAADEAAWEAARAAPEEAAALEAAAFRAEWEADRAAAEAAALEAAAHAAAAEVVSFLVASSSTP